jgi:hypothetical protein
MKPLPRTFWSVMLLSGLLLISATSPSLVEAEVISVDDPLNPGLAPGENFHLAFVSNGTTGVGYSHSVSVCNAFVTGQASLSGSAVEDLGLTWSAIVSTGSSQPSTHAYNNAPVSAPVYLIDGTPVATGYADFWDGSLDGPINVSHFGSAITSGTNGVWTGSYSNGQEHTYWPVGAALTEYGNLTASDSRWIDTTYRQYYYKGPFRMYALSPVLTVEEAVIPEPSTLVTFSGLLGMGLIGYWRRRRKA